MSQLASLAGNLQCYLLPSNWKHCVQRYEPYYKAAYLFWRAMLKEGLHSEGLVKEADELNSDRFLLQDEIVCLFDQGMPVGLIAFDWMNLTCPVNRDQSYLSQFPECMINQLFDAAISIIMIMGHLSVHPDWR